MIHIEKTEFLGNVFYSAGKPKNKNPLSKSNKFFCYSYTFAVRLLLNKEVELKSKTKQKSNRDYSK